MSHAKQINLIAIPQKNIVSISETSLLYSRVRNDRNQLSSGANASSGNANGNANSGNLGGSSAENASGSGRGGSGSAGGSASNPGLFVVVVFF